MLQRSVFVLAAVVAAMTWSAQAWAGGKILTNDGRQIYQAPSGVGAYHSGIAQLHGPHQDFIGLGDRDDAAELVLNHMSVMIDPKAHYLDRSPGRIDENHSYLRAQRLYAARHALPTRVIRRDSMEVIAEPRTIKPSFVIFKPDYLDRRPKLEGATPAIPVVPRRQEEPMSNLMVLAR